MISYKIARRVVNTERSLRSQWFQQETLLVPQVSRVPRGRSRQRAFQLCQSPIAMDATVWIAAARDVMLSDMPSVIQSIRIACWVDFRAFGNSGRYAALAQLARRIPTETIQERANLW